MEATPEQSAEGLAIVHVLATVLDRLVVANASLARTDPGQVTKFHAMKAPGIGILQYLERYDDSLRCLSFSNVDETASLTRECLLTGTEFTNMHHARMSALFSRLFILTD